MGFSKKCGGMYKNLCFVSVLEVTKDTKNHKYGNERAQNFLKHNCFVSAILLV